MKTKQIFSKKDHKKFVDFFNIKNNESQIEKKFYKKTIKFLKFIKWIPGIRMVGIGNSISMNCATDDSDIDLLIVTDKNRMWLVRILTSLIFQILGVRKTKNKHAGRFCLSFFCTTKGLDFGNFNLKNDIYLYFWIVYFKPILDYNNTYNLFIEKNSSWANFNSFKNIIENNEKYIKIKKKRKTILLSPSGILSFKSKGKGLQIRLLNFIDNLLKKIFLPKTKKAYQKLGQPFGVIINNNMLKFHDNDIRNEIKEKIIIS